MRPLSVDLAGGSLAGRLSDPPLRLSLPALRQGRRVASDSPTEPSGAELIEVFRTPGGEYRVHDDVGHISARLTRAEAEEVVTRLQAALDANADHDSEAQ